MLPQLYPKFKLSLDKYVVCTSDFDDIENNYVRIERVYIGCSGNQVFTDNRGYRYVPIIPENSNADKAALDSIMFSECSYLVIAPSGSVEKLVDLKKIT
jgi:hypothetical protein